MAFDAFLSIDGLADSSAPAGHQGQMEILSFSWGVSNSVAVGSTSGAGAGRVSISDFTFTKVADAASPALFLACAQGTLHPTATVTLIRAGGGPAQGSPTPFIEYDLTDVVVQSVQWSGSSGGGEAPMESVSLAFAKVLYKVASQNADGTPATGQTGWDLAANKQV